MSNHLIKLHRYKQAESRIPQKDGKIVLKRPSFCQEIPLVDKKPEIVRKRRETETNTETWFGNAADQPTPSPQTPSAIASVSSIPTSQIQTTPSLSLVYMPEKSFIQERVSECQKEFEQLTTSLKSKYAASAARDAVDYTKSTVPDGWKLNGVLVAHLHEHKSAVTRMASLKPGGPLFSSVSNDGTVRIWDSNKLDGHQSINRSRQYYIANTPLNAVAACDNGQSVAIAGINGCLLVLKIDPNSSKMALQTARQLEENTPLNRSTMECEEGAVVDMQPMDQLANGGSLIVYATLYGAIVGWDLRMPTNAFKLKSDLKNGVITTFCIDPTGSWLAAGTSSGRHLCWDLRFGLKIAEIKHPNELRIRRITCNPTEPSCLISASQGNNEVFSWNIETNSRQTALWAGQAPPLSNANVSSQSHSVCALLPGVVDGRGFLITGGTDQRIRFWDLQDPANCSLVVPAPKDVAPASISYE